MPDAEAVDEDGQGSARAPVPNGTADHETGDQQGGGGEQNGVAEHNGRPHEDNSAAYTPADKQVDKPLTFLDHEVRTSVQHSELASVRHCSRRCRRLTVRVLWCSTMQQARYPVVSP